MDETQSTQCTVPPGPNCSPTLNAGQNQAPMMQPGQQGMFYQPVSQPYIYPNGQMMPHMQGTLGYGQMVSQMQWIPGYGQMVPQMQGTPGYGQMVGQMMQGATGVLAVIGQIIGQVIGQLHVAADDANSASEAVKRGLHSVKVSRFDATEVERQLQGELFDKWHESCEVVKATKIPFSNMNGYLDHLQENYEGITPEIRKKMNGLLWSEGEWEYKLTEWKFNMGNSSEARYGMIAFGRSPDKEYVDCMYVMFKMDFKVAPKKIVERKERSLFLSLIKWETVSQHTEERSLGTKDIGKLKNFFRSKALEGFYKEGVIEKINYVKSLEDVPKDDIKS